MQLIVLGSSSTGNGYLLQSNAGEILIIETGISLKRFKESLSYDFQYSKIAGALISHSHNDHSGKVLDYLRAGIRCYASPETIDEKKLEMCHNFLPVREKFLYNAGSYKFMPFILDHDVKCYGYLIRHDECGQVVFITDTLHCPYTFRDLNHMIVEANYSEEILESNILRGGTNMTVRDRVVNSHMSLETCKKFIMSNDLSSLRNIVLIHLSSSNSNETGFIQEIQQLTGKAVFAAKGGMKINLNKQPF